MRIAFAGLLLLAATLSGQPLKIYAIDTEGGKSTLYVSPSGESMLIDTGYDGFESRDAKRIVAAATAAGVKRIDHLVITHYHGDHAGGVPQLAKAIPIGTIYDYGDDHEIGNPKTTVVYDAYLAVRNQHAHHSLKPGETIPVKGLKVEVVASDGHSIAKPLPEGGQPNPLCDKWETLPPDPGENARSAAMIITFGKLRISDLGDLYWEKERDLACPVNKLGTVDIYMTTHHGTKTSGPPQMVYALHPKVAIMNNGADKGGSVKAWTTIKTSPDLEDLWQLHYSEEGGKEHNVDEKFIANPGTEDDKGYAIELTVRADGSFTVKNERNGFEKTYHK